MTKPYRFAAMATVLLAGALFVSATPARAQAPAQSRPVGGIALLDVNDVFKDHPRFKAAMNDLEMKVKMAEQEVKQEKETIKGLGERLKDFHSGSPDYKQIEEELATRQSKLSVTVGLHRKEFLQQEAKIYHTIYQEIEQEVQYVAASNGIAVVLRYSGAPVDPEKPDDILRDINKSVVWYQPGLDITPIIKQRLAARGGTQPSPAGNAPVAPSANRMGVPYQQSQQR